jgi:cell division septation protein DedD
MAKLSAAGTQLVQEIANRYGISTDGVTHMLIAVHNGNGSMAQFSHPDFGGSGQWMRGGMTMVSDLFNNQLKFLVDSVCNDLSNGLAGHQTSPFSGSFQSQSQNGSHAQSQSAGQLGSNNSLFVPDPSAQWWPPELGTPSAIGSQNSVRYAYFSNGHRLAVTTGGKPWVYDTLDHMIGGFGQQQGGGQSITFTSQYGTVSLSTLPVVMRDGLPVHQAPVQPTPAQPPMQTPAPPPPSHPAAIETKSTELPAQGPARDNADDVIAMLERLGQLMEKGYISKEEFATKKSELLGRL